MLPWNECLHGVGAQVIMEFVHMHEGLVWFPAVAGIIESGPSDIELQSGSSITVAAVSKDRLYREDFHWSYSCRTHPQQLYTDAMVARQHTLLQVAQAHKHQSDSHVLVEYNSLLRVVHTTCWSR